MSNSMSSNASISYINNNHNHSIHVTRVDNYIVTYCSACGKILDVCQIQNNYDFTCVNIPTFNNGQLQRENLTQTQQYHKDVISCKLNDPDIPLGTTTIKI